MTLHEFDVCLDCYLLAMTGDESPFDYHYGDGAETRLAEVWSGLSNISPGEGHWSDDTEQDEEFSWRSCECCNQGLGGSRHRLIWVQMKGETGE